MLQVQHYWTTDYAEIKRHWLLLEAQSECSVFVSWQWIGVWLETYQPQVLWLQVYQNDSVVGLALFTQRQQRRRGLIASNQLHLHQTGDPAEDQIWIEYNRVLARQGMSEAVEQAMLQYLATQLQDWDELSIAGMPDAVAAQWGQQAGLSRKLQWQAPCYGVDLETLRQQQQGYQATLSANTRYQIGRSLRAYQQFGAVRLEQPASIQQALNWFDAIAPWHIQRWGAKPGQSGFSNARFLAFHHAMIQQHWQNNGLAVLALMAGEQHLATFYQLHYRGRVYFYLAGMQPEQDNKRKPGLLGHCLCIEHYLQQGSLYYDFMAGEERYKKQLGQQHDKLCQFSLQRPRLRFTLETLAQRTKHCIQRMVRRDKRLVL